jgi:hypothetical protein
VLYGMAANAIRYSTVTGFRIVRSYVFASPSRLGEGRILPRINGENLGHSGVSVNHRRFHDNLEVLCGAQAVR